MSEMASTEASVEQAGTAAEQATGGEPSQVEGAQQAQATEAPPDPRVMGRLDELTGMMQSFAPFIEQMGQGQQQEQGDPFAEFGGEEFANHLGEQMGLDPEQAMQNFRQLAQAEAQRLVQQEVGPIQEQLRHQAFVELESKYADLQDPQKAAAVLDSAERHASEFAQAVGLPPQVVPALALSPGFVELVHKAEMADQYAASQSGRGEQQEVQLEGAAASPGAEEPSPQERIVSAQGGGTDATGHRWF